MIKIQKNIAYTQVLEILNYIKIEDYYKIPKELICALENNQEKDFLDQNVSQEAKLILAIFFKRYWATDKQKEKIRVYEINKIAEIEEEKKKIYPQNIMTDEIAREKIEEKKQNQLAVINKKNWFQKLLQKFRNKFLVR